MGGELELVLMATRADEPRFFQVCVFDEGHMLKNFQSSRYENLMKIPAGWRLLLTGTPLQNNLQELVVCTIAVLRWRAYSYRVACLQSLLNFIMPDLFIRHEGSLRAIFKTKADSSLSFLSRGRISRAKKMMTPFVLRRRKDQVGVSGSSRFTRKELIHSLGFERST